MSSIWCNLHLFDVLISSCPTFFACSTILALVRMNTISTDGQNSRQTRTAKISFLLYVVVRLLETRDSQLVHRHQMYNTRTSWLMTFNLLSRTAQTHAQLRFGRVLDLLWCSIWHGTSLLTRPLLVNYCTTPLSELHLSTSKFVRFHSFLNSLCLRAICLLFGNMLQIQIEIQLFRQILVCFTQLFLQWKQLKNSCFDSQTLAVPWVPWVDSWFHVWFSFVCTLSFRAAQVAFPLDWSKWFRFNCVCFCYQWTMVFPTFSNFCKASSVSHNFVL